MKEFGRELIRCRRLESNLSVAKLSRITRIPKSSLFDLETGKFKDFKVYRLIKLCNVLNIDLINLIDDEEFNILSDYFNKNRKRKKT